MHTRKLYLRYFNEDTLLIYKNCLRSLDFYFQFAHFHEQMVCAVGLIDRIKEGTDAVQGK